MIKKKLLLYLGILGGGVGLIYAIKKIFETEIEKKEAKIMAEAFDKIVELKEKMFKEIGDRFMQENPALYKVWSKYKEIILKHSKQFGIPVVILTSLVYQESSGNPKAYRYEPRQPILYPDQYPGDDPVYPGIKMNQVVIFYVEGGKIKGKINIPQLNYTRPLENWEIEGTKDIKGLIDLLGVRNLVKQGKLIEATVKMNQELKKYNANIFRAASIGLCQLMYNTALSIDPTISKDPKKLFDPDYNLYLGAKYLRQKYDQYGNWQDALAAYNTGKPYRATQKGKSYVQAISKRFMTEQEFNTVFTA
jgi:hypothetical protein